MPEQITQKPGITARKGIQRSRPAAILRKDCRRRDLIRQTEERCEVRLHHLIKFGPFLLAPGVILESELIQSPQFLSPFWLLIKGHDLANESHKLLFCGIADWRYKNICVPARFRFVPEHAESECFFRQANPFKIDSEIPKSPLNHRRWYKRRRQLLTND